MINQLLNQIAQLKEEVTVRLATIASLPEVMSFRIEYLGKNGKITHLVKQLGALQGSERPLVGQRINQLKSYVESKCEELSSEIEARIEHDKIKQTSIDITVPPRPCQVGRIHPITRTMMELIEVFTDMGFSVYEGPEVETDFYNFEALNTPKDHPARDMQDTFYIDDERLLRTHTSPIQIRVMQSMPPPIFMIGPGAVYRRDTPDLTHSPMFYQVEGLMVDERITFGDLKGVLTEFVRRVFGKGTKVRFRPSFFPFTEPSAELEIGCVMCKGKGCRVCKGGAWLEVLGCGMVNPRVFEAVGYDPDTVSGFAFGMGVDRVAMLKYNINDIRLFYENYVRFLEQF